MTQGREQLEEAFIAAAPSALARFEPDEVYCADARDIASRIAPASVALAVWSPPYHVGKAYERGIAFDEWQAMLYAVIDAHAAVLKPGGFLAVNIADILCFKDASLPRMQAENVVRRKRADITREMVLDAMAAHPGAGRRAIAQVLGCSEQTVDRRLKGNNIRGGKYQTQTRVKLVCAMLEEHAYTRQLYLYDRRIWVKDAAWENSRWHTMSYRAVDEFEYLLVFWKPGPTKVDRARLTKDEWSAWGSRAVWNIASVRANDDHVAKFPLELPRRAIRLFTDPGDLVLDCFAGSGTSGVAAIEEGRRFIGVELDAGYARLARRALFDALGVRRQARLDLGE